MKNSGWIIFWSIVLVLSLWIGSFFLIRCHFPTSYVERGQFGDLFGAVNALFSGLAFAGIIYTIILQQKEIEENAKEVKKQNEATALQQFENTFFNMLTMLNEILLSVAGKLNLSSRFIEGKNSLLRESRGYIHSAAEELVSLNDANFVYEFQDDLFVQFHNDTIQGAEKNTPTGKKLSIDEMRDNVNEIFKGFYKDKSHALAHYFRYVYRIMKFVIESPLLSDQNKVKYIELLQTQLSNDELCLIFYDALSMYGRNKKGNDLFKQWLDKYKVLENIDPTNLMDKIHIHFYEETEFKFTTFK